MRVLLPTPQDGGCGRGWAASGRRLGREGAALVNGIGALLKGAQGGSFTPCTSRPQQQGATYKAESPVGMESAVPPCYKWSGLRYFARTAPADSNRGRKEHPCLPRACSWARPPRCAQAQGRPLEVSSGENPTLHAPVAGHPPDGSFNSHRPVWGALPSRVWSYSFPSLHRQDEEPVAHRG